MSATTNGAQPYDFSEMSGMHEHQWVSDLLRYVAEADGGRIRIVRHELKRRGLLDPMGVPAPRQAPDAV